MSKFTPDWKEGYADGLSEACRIIAQMLRDEPKEYASDFMQGWEQGRTSTLRTLQDALGWKELRQRLLKEAAE